MDDEFKRKNKRKKISFDLVIHGIISGQKNEIIFQSNQIKSN